MLYVIKICLGHKRAWCETLNKRNSLICCYFIPSSLEVFGFSCFFFIKKVIIYRTSVLSSLICQNIGWETERSMSVENNGLNRLFSLSLSHSLFLISSWVPFLELEFLFDGTEGWWRWITCHSNISRRMKIVSLQWYCIADILVRASLFLSITSCEKGSILYLR